MTYASCVPRTPYAGLLERWQGLAAGQWCEQASRLASKRGIVSGGEAPIRFGPAGRETGAADYERRIHDTGVVGCRIGGAGERHDQHNAAVWLTLPATKAALNRLHCSRSPDGRSRNGRTRRRDFATLLDESGLAWVSADAACDSLLRERHWHGLFVDGRERVRAAVTPVVIGHGLLDKLSRPYKALTAQVLFVRAADSPTPDSASGPSPPIDRCIAAAILAAARSVPDEADGAVRGPWPLAPLPVLALPDWCDDNRDPLFYADPTVFRAAWPCRQVAPTIARAALIAPP